MCERNRTQTASTPDEAAILRDERIERLGQIARVMRKEAQRLQDRAVFLSRHADQIEQKADSLRRGHEAGAFAEEIAAEELRLVSVHRRSSDTPAPDPTGGASRSEAA